MRWLIPLVVTLTAAAGCGGTGGGGTGGGGSCGTDTWASFAGNFFQTRCNGCHDWTQAEVKSDPEVVQAVQEGYMPPGTPPSQQDIDRLVAWANCGQP